jgi:hypothetical protein
LPQSHDRERSLDHDLAATIRTLRERFGRRVEAIALGGSFGRGEGCLWNQDGRWVPGNNLNFFLITDGELPAAEIEDAAREIQAKSLTPSVILTPYCEARLASLPQTLESVELQQSGKLIDGDPGAIAKLPRYDLRRFPLQEAERQLRLRLGTLLESRPSAGAEQRSAYQAAKAVFASVDAFLIRNRSYVISYREKVARLKALHPDADLVRLVDRALEAKLGGQLPADSGVEEFWSAALHLHINSFLGLFRSSGSSRPERLRHLLSSFHFQSVSWPRSVGNWLRLPFHRDPQGRIERLLLALAIARDPLGIPIDLADETRRAGLAAAPCWDSILGGALDRWHQVGGRQPSGASS